MPRKMRFFTTAVQLCFVSCFLADSLCGLLVAEETFAVAELVRGSGKLLVLRLVGLPFPFPYRVYFAVQLFKRFAYR